MKALKREGTMDNVQWPKRYLKKNESCKDYCYEKANKSELVEAVFNRVLGKENFSWYEVKKMKKAELLKIADNNGLLYEKGRTK